MLQAWFVVEVFCALAVYRAITSILTCGGEPALLAMHLLSLLLTLVLTALTLLGRRLPRRMLAALIVGNALFLVWRYVTLNIAPPPLLAAVILLAAYLVVGAIKLWRMAGAPDRGNKHA
jgi:hypothetical protein